jgi:redox-sensing transcriptional repressor
VIEPLAHLEQRIRDKSVEIGIVTVPAQAAQEVADMMVGAGVRSLLNFSPRVLKVPENVILRNVDLSVNLEVLSFNLSFFSRKL